MAPKSDNTDPKMSAVLLDFAEPLLPEDATEDEQSIALSMASMVWNACLLPDAEREKARGELAIKFSHGDPHHMMFFLNAFESMLKRKRETYPDLRNIIVDYQFIPTKHGLRFEVKSAPPRSDT